jgi:2-keto-4-pentenoate hydratase/2-oxohepta-3-ene-1,7-dioic acid hydratase in catechol pathway
LKFVSFARGDDLGYGIVVGASIQRLDLLPGAPADLKTYLAHRFPDLAPRHVAANEVPLADVALLPPIPNPGNIFCIATNFHEDGKPVPEFPLLFMRHAEAQTGHECPIMKPAVSEKLDFEGELAVIVGKSGYKIPRAHAMEHVAGYACFNEGSVRDWQKHSTQFTPGKNFRHSGAFGPWMVCTQEIPDPSRLVLSASVNGEVKQSIGIDRMIFDIPYLIAYISTFAPLHPGDVIVTGTPSGFGSSRNPPEFLSVGDRVEVEISGIGILRNMVAQDTDDRGYFRNI